MEASSDTINSSLTTSKHKGAFGCSTKQSLLKQPLNKDLKPLRALLSSTTLDTSASVVNGGKIGVLLLNLGDPETLDNVQPFLFNLLADPDIIRLPRLFRFLQKPLAQFISVARAPKSKEVYAAISGGSPLCQMTDDQAKELRKALYEKNVPAEEYVGMRYWHPFTEEAIEQDHFSIKGVLKSSNPKQQFHVTSPAESTLLPSPYSLKSCILKICVACILSLSHKLVLT